MKRVSRLTVVLIGVVLAVTAGVGCGPSSAPDANANVWALVLEVRDSGIQVHSARPSRGRVLTTALASRAAEVGRRDSLWFEYSLRGKSNQVLTNGSFPVSMTAVVEPGGPGAPWSTVRLARRIVTVAVPYDPAATSIAFRRAEPTAAPPDAWQRLPAGESGLATQGGK